MRTGETALTDDELILLDVMFDGGAYFESLRRDIFREHWNYPSHNLDDTSLQKALSRLCLTGALQAHSTKGGTHFAFTPHGGELWELERLPAWWRYAREWYPHQGMVAITAVSEGVVAPAS